MNSNVSQQASLPTRVKVWFSGLPFVTRTLLVVCVGIYAVQLLTGGDNFGPVCLSAYQTVAKLQVYRLLTGVVFHVGLLHIAFNMMAFVPIGKSLERSLGSVQFAHLMLLIAALGGCVYVLLSYAAASGPFGLGPGFLHRCAVGASGLVFGLIVVDNAQSSAAMRSIFGLFQVPARVYPWALMVFWQLLMPGVSFLGHLAGVLMGQLYVWGYLNRLMLSNASIQRLEASPLLARVYGTNAFIAHAGGGSLPTSTLPVSRHASVSGEGEDRSAQWFQRGWLPVPTSEPHASQQAQQGAFGGKAYTIGSAAPGPLHGSSHTRTVVSGPPVAASRAHIPPQKPAQTFSGRGHVVGGPSAMPAAPSAAAAAAATAAEARMMQQVQQRQRSSGGGEPLPQPSSAVQPQPDQQAALAGPHAGALRQLEAMGFPRPAASAALDAADGDVHTAIEMLSNPE